MPDPNVNVIFHGLFLFMDQKSAIHVLIPNMDEDHVYRAGNFLVEETLMPRKLPRSYHLTGVNSGEGAFNPAENVVFNKVDYNHHTTSDALYCRIILPRPAEILSLRPTRDEIEASNDPGNIVNGHHPSGVQVLRYVADDLSQVSFSPHSAELDVHQIDGNTFLNLHIIAEPDHDMDDMHPIDGFGKMIHLLSHPGNIHVTNATPLDSVPPADEATIEGKGFFIEETLDLLDRRRVLRNAGNVWRQGGTYPTGAGFPVGAGSTACWPINGNPGRG
jgi:hypothetical protein